MKFTLGFILATWLSVATGFGQNIRPKKIIRLIERSEVFRDQFTGFALYDLEARKELAVINGDKYFTPASNTKLFTLYAGLKLLGDSIPGLQYVIRGDSLIFWGTGDATFLHPDYPEQKIAAFLRNSGKDLYWSSGRYQGDFYGYGWAYDDYNEYYQPEISELPLYGNVLRLYNEGNTLRSIPDLSERNNLNAVKTGSTQGRYRVIRELKTNKFHIPGGQVPQGFTQTIPFVTDSSTVESLLKANFSNYKGQVTYSLPKDVNILYSIPSDTLYRNLMLPSDNFIAEHILLNISAQNDLEMNTAKVIKHVKDRFLTDLPKNPLWVDGSGMSRMNMFTPRTIVKLCEMIYDEINNEKRLFDLFPQGGKTGTIRNLYKSEKPFIFAKTGSLNYTSSLSGYLITKKGKKLVFSFLNNNYTRPSGDIRAEMEKVLTSIYNDY